MGQKRLPDRAGSLHDLELSADLLQSLEELASLKCILV